MTVATILPPLYNISRKREASRPLDLRASFGANDVTRTHDLLITNQLLYRLSYISIFTFGVADLILTNQLLYRLSYISVFTFRAADLILRISCSTD